MATEMEWRATSFSSPPTRSVDILFVGGHEEVRPVYYPPPEPLPRLRACVYGLFSPAAEPLTVLFAWQLRQLGGAHELLVRWMAAGVDGMPAGA